MKTLKCISTLLLVAVFSLIFIGCEKTEPKEDFIEGSLKSELVSGELADDAITLYGPEKFLRLKGKPKVVRIEIEDFENFKETCSIIIENGDKKGNNRVSSALVKVNGEEIFRPSNFSQTTSILSKAFTLSETLYLEVELRSKPNSYIQITILGNPKDDLCMDCEGNVYRTVKIGNQIWMAENLKTTKYNDCSDIPFVTDNDEWSKLTTPGYSWYNNDEATYKATYGALYNWYTVNTGKLCPTGWHVPTDAEWKILEMYIGMTQEEADTEDNSRGDKGGKLKEAGEVHWIYGNAGATNETGFTALPGGNHGHMGDFSAMHKMCQMWSSTPFNDPDAWQRFVSYGEPSIGRDHPSKADGKSIRCVKD